MASLLLLVAATVSLLSSPAVSVTCKTQTFSKHNLTFANCTDLSTLDASLHWNYDAAAKTLSIAFTAPPAKPDGWVAWALNPTGTGMAGAQALVAFAAPNGSTLVKTYNITSYGPISESPISYHVLAKSAESSKGAITIFATLALPEGTAPLNQIWQVGSAVVDGVPAKHAFAPDNLASKGTLQLAAEAAPGGGAPAPAPGLAAAAPGGGQSGNVNGGESAWGSGLGVFGICVMLGVSIFGF